MFFLTVHYTFPGAIKIKTKNKEYMIYISFIQKFQHLLNQFGLFQDLTRSISQIPKLRVSEIRSFKIQ